MSWRPLLVLAGVVVLVVAALAWFNAHRPKPYTKLPGPLDFVQETTAAKVELTIDPKIAAFPLLSDRLYRDGVAELKAFAAQAAEDQQRLRAKGQPTRRYWRRLSWKLTAATPRLVSVRQTWIDDTGGAHASHGADGMLWDPWEDRTVLRSELFRPGADVGRLDGVLCDAIKAQTSQLARCPSWRDGDFVLAQSRAPGKAAGLVFLYDPRSLGPDVEGAAAVAVPVDRFRSELAPVWTDAFVGG